MHLCYGSKDFFPEQKKTWYFTGSINLKAKNATISVACSWTLKSHPRRFPVPLKAYSYVVTCRSSFPLTLCPKKIWGQPLILFKLKKMCAEEKLERRCWEGILKKYFTNFASKLWQASSKEDDKYTDVWKIEHPEIEKSGKKTKHHQKPLYQQSL